MNNKTGDENNNYVYFRRIAGSYFKIAAYDPATPMLQGSTGNWYLRKGKLKEFHVRIDERELSVSLVDRSKFEPKNKHHEYTYIGSIFLYDEATGPISASYNDYLEFRSDQHRKNLYKLVDKTYESQMKKHSNS